MFGKKNVIYKQKTFLEVPFVNFLLGMPGSPFMGPRSAPVRPQKTALRAVHEGK